MDVEELLALMNPEEYGKHMEIMSAVEKLVSKFRDFELLESRSDDGDSNRQEELEINGD